MSYLLKTDYTVTTPVSATDLNRRGDIIASQLPLALEGIGVGVYGSSDFLANATDVQAGIAIIRSDDGTPVAVRSMESLPIPARGSFEYLHLALRVPEFGDDETGNNSVRGAAPVLVLSEDDEEPDAILLAQWDGAQWEDRRPRSNAALLLQLMGYVGYDADAFTKGSVKERLDKLENTGDIDPDAGISGATFTAFKNYVNDRFDALEARQDALEARIEDIVGAADIRPYPFDLLADETVHNRGGLSLVNPSIVETGLIAVVTQTAGHNQFDTPDFSPDTGDARELRFNATDGTFGGDV